MRADGKAVGHYFTVIRTRKLAFVAQAHLQFIFSDLEWIAIRLPPRRVEVKVKFLVYQSMKT